MSGSDWIKREKVSCKQWRRNRKKKGKGRTERKDGRKTKRKKNDILKCFSARKLPSVCIFPFLFFANEHILEIVQAVGVTVTMGFQLT